MVLDTKIVFTSKICFYLDIGRRNKKGLLRHLDSFLLLIIKKLRFIRLPYACQIP